MFEHAVEAILEVGVSRIARSLFNADSHARTLIRDMAERQKSQPSREPSLSPTSTSSNCAPEVSSCSYERRSETSMTLN